MGRSEVSTSVAKCSEGLSNSVSTIIRRYTDHISLLLVCLFPLSHSFIFFWFHLFTVVYMVVCFVCFV